MCVLDVLLQAALLWILLCLLSSQSVPFNCRNNPFVVWGLLVVEHLALTFDELSFVSLSLHPSSSLALFLCDLMVSSLQQSASISCSRVSATGPFLVVALGST